MSVRFDAATDRVAYTGGAPDPAAGFTLTAWVWISVDRDDFSTIARLYTGGGGGTTATFATTISGTGGPGYFTAGGSITATGGLPVGEWRKVAFTCLGTDGAVYLAPPVGVTEVVAGTVAGEAGPTAIAVGGRSVGNASEWLNGRLAYVRVWTAQLTQGEIEAEWESTTPVRTTGLWADWPLEVHTDLTDHSGNGRDLVAGSTSTTTEDGPPIVPPVEQLAGTLPVVVSLAGVLDVPPATVGQLTGTLPVLAGFAGVLDVPTPSVPQLTGTLPVVVSLAGTLDVPPATVGQLTGQLPVVVALSGVLSPAAAVPELVGALAVTVTVGGVLSVPPPGPPPVPVVDDPLSWCVADAVADCLCAQLPMVSKPVGCCCVLPGAQALVDDCQAGQAWVRVASVYALGPVFPGSADGIDLGPCGQHYGWAVVLEMGVARCMPPMRANGKLPDCEEYRQTARLIAADGHAMRRAAVCCDWRTTCGLGESRYQAGAYTPFGPDGTCVGGTMQLLVEVPGCLCDPPSGDSGGALAGGAGG